MKTEEKIAALGITLPEAPRPLAAYVPAVQSGSLVFISGQLPVLNGALMMTGKLGAGLSLEDGQAAARQAAINCLGVLKATAGDLDRVKRIVKITGFVQSDDAFYDQPKVINGASELFQAVFGEAGVHARAAVGVNALPLNAPVEVELIAELAD